MHTSHQLPSVTTTLKRVLVKFIGIQEGIKGVIPDFALYNLLESVAGIPVDSTITSTSMRKLGYEIDIQE